MNPTRACAIPRWAALGVLITLLTGCSSDRAGENDDGEASQRPEPVPTASRPPEEGKGSKDPDDVNGDGHRDLVIAVPVGKPGSQGTEQRLAIVFGSEHGLDPARRTLYSHPDLGLPEPRAVNRGDSATTLRGPVTTADLDGDGFPDFVKGESVLLSDEEADRSGAVMNPRTDTYISWGGPSGPTHRAKAVRLQLPALPRQQGISQLNRGDFDGDGHLDLAGTRQDGQSVELLYGPFTRAGVPARTGSRAVPEGEDVSYGGMIAAAPGGRGATSLFVHFDDDGEQTGGILFAAGNKGGIAATGRVVRDGNAFAFGDFDGDGTADLAVGDNGSRNDEPGTETEPPDVAGSYAVYPGNGGAPRSYRLPGEHASIRMFAAADPDGDGTDSLLVGATDGGAVLLDGERQTARLSRSGPDRLDGKRIPADERSARVESAGDFDGDGRDEVVLGWTSQALYDSYGTTPLQWWITEGLTGRDQLTFSTRTFAAGAKIRLASPPPDS